MDTPQRTILIADANRDAADTLAMVLDFLGYRTFVAYDGEQAVRLAGEHTPDAVILDINMPLMDGYEAARSIRREGGATRTILIALTAVSGSEAVRQAQEAGFDVHLVKPLGGDQIEGVLRSVLADGRRPSS